MRALLVAVCSLAAALSVLQAQSPQQPAGAKPVRLTPGEPARNVEDVMSRVAAYIDDYADKMSLAIGVERYAQFQQREDAVPTSPAGRAISRQTVAEFALVRNKSDWDG